VRKNAAGADQHVKPHKVYKRFAGIFLREGVADGALFLNAFQADGERLMLVERKAQSFARNGLLDYEFF